MSAVKLRNGVQVEKGIEKEGSPYYIVDYPQGKEWHICTDYVSYILGTNRRWRAISSEDKSDCDEFLEGNNLLAGQRVEKPKIPLYQKAMAVPIKLISPHEYLEETKVLWSWIFGPYGFLLLFCLFVSALYLLSGSYGELFDYFGAYSLADIYVVVALILVKAVHEFGHAMSIVKYGGYVSSINIVLIGGMPLPKNDAVRMHRTGYLQRAFIGASGMYLELIMALICAIFWVLVEDGPLRVALHFIAVVSLPLTLAINMIPLMKFDGYYILSSALKSPRLYENGVDSFRYELYRFVGLKPQNITLTSNVSDEVLVVYGVLIFGWKVLLPIGLATALVNLFDSRAAYLFALLPFYTMWVLPLMKEFKRAAEAYESDGFKKPSYSLILTIISLVVALGWFLIPINHKEVVSGAIIRDHYTVRSTTEGLTDFVALEGDISAGGTLAKIIPVGTAQELVQADIYDSEARSASVKRKFEKDGPNVLSQRSKNTRLQAKALSDDGVVTSSDKGTWIPSETKPLVKVGDELGKFYFDRTKVSSYVQVNKSYGNLVNASAILPDGTVIKTELSKKATLNDTSVLPEWLDVHGVKGSFVVFESSYMDKELPEMPIQIVVERKYSIALELFRKLVSAGV